MARLVQIVPCASAKVIALPVSLKNINDEVRLHAAVGVTAKPNTYAAMWPFARTIEVRFKQERRRTLLAAAPHATANAEQAT